MSKVVVIWSSPNTDGLTASAKNQFIKGLTNVGAEIEEIAFRTGRGTLECLTQLERGLTHMGMRAYDRIPVVRYNKDYILPALELAGETYAKTLETGFNMYY